ncbi:MAG TPA: tRNA pseudouridine(55) synthase TruB, partial [Candidatus Tumulicola sp.]|nr:tRNA pseudouridine(55) synthase TruB [Candidatus Tumulicola sp.]
GRATRLLPLIPESRKQYVFELVLGAATETGDARGRVTERADVPAGWQAKLPAVAAALVGPIDQVPPMYSAVKIEGTPLYVSARKGRTVARRSRRTYVHELRVLESAERTARLLVECEAGAYVRSLCEELGRGLGLPAHMGPLLRTAAGPFALADSYTPEEIAADPSACLVDPLGVLPHERVEVDAAGAARFAHGNPVKSGAVAGSNGDVIVMAEGRILGVGRVTQEGAVALIAPLRVLADKTT